SLTRERLDRRRETLRSGRERVDRRGLLERELAGEDGALRGAGDARAAGALGDEQCPVRGEEDLLRRLTVGREGSRAGRGLERAGAATPRRARPAHAPVSRAYELG